jgi:hypothetical protein
MNLLEMTQMGHIQKKHEALQSRNVANDLIYAFVGIKKHSK